MGGLGNRDDDFRSGDHWVIDDRTGVRIRSSEAVQEWDGTIVHVEDAEPRHPQDFVRAKADRQAARWPVRPEPVDRFVGPRQTLLSADVAAGSRSLPVESTAGFDVGDRVILYLENSDALITLVWDGSEPILDEAGVPIRDELGEIIYDEPPAAIAGTIYLRDALPWSAASGAEVANYTDTPTFEEAL